MISIRKNLCWRLFEFRHGGVIAAVVAIFLPFSWTTTMAQSACATTKSSLPQTELLRLLNDPKINKSQYETDEAYHSRLTKIMPEADHLTVVIPMPRDTGKYDAEAQTFTIDNPALVAFFPEQFLLDGDPYTKVFLGREFGTKRSTKGSYVGENSFGVKRQVSVDQLDLYDIVFPQKEGSPPVEGLTISIPREVAKNITGRLIVVVSGALVAPYVIEDSDYAAPTVQAPHDLSVRRKAFVIQPDCTAVVDGVSGQVLSTFDSTSLQ